MTIGRIVAESMALVSSIVVARLVTPGEFGSAAVAAVVNALALGLAQQGIGSPLVQMKKLRREHVRAATLLGLLVGFVGTVAVAAASYALTPVFSDEICNLVLLSAPSFLFAGFAAVPQALLQRRLDFRGLSINEIVAGVLGALTAIVAAALGLGGEAIVLGLLMTTGSAALLMAHRARPGKPGWDRKAGRQIVDFGLPASGASLTYTASRNIDYVLLGAILGPTATGYYWRAFQLGVDYQSKVSGILLRVAFPVFSRAPDLESVRELRGRIVRLHAVLIFPFLGLLVAVAHTLIPWLYGQAWEPAVAPARILAVAGMSVAVATGTGPLMLATGHPRALRNYGVVSLLLFIPVVALAAPHGLITVCVAVTVYRVLSLLASQYVLVERIVGISLAETLQNDVVPALLCTAFLIGAASGTLQVLPDAPAAVQLLAAGAAGLFVYGLTLTRFFPAARADVDRLTARLVSRRSKA